MISVHLVEKEIDLQILEKNEQKRLGISDETLNAMKRFFLNTSVPRMIKDKRKNEIK